MPGRAAHGDTITRAEAGAQLAMLLVNMPADRLAAATVDSLAAINRSPRGHIAAALEAERRRRG